jgi:hypothetical protein
MVYHDQLKKKKLQKTKSWLAEVATPSRPRPHLQLTGRTAHCCTCSKNLQNTEIY